MRWLGIFLLMVATFGVGAPAAAHESRPLYVEIVEQAANAFHVTWKIPPSATSVTSPRIVMPEPCSAAAPPAGSDLVKRQLFTCRSDLSGETIRIDFPGYNPSIATLFRFQRQSGEAHTQIKSPDDATYTVPDPEAIASVAKEYGLLGIEHILKGYDHLLFVTCLVFIAGTWRRILITITGFTLAHSVTLALAALGWVRLPTPPVEAAIALSIVFLATEIARDRRDTLTWRYPITVAASFGLLHGFGFATVLGEIGLPQTEIPAALLAFNVGVELGQVMFVGILLAAFAILKSLALRSSSVSATQRVSTRMCAYGIGTLAVFWTLERMTNF
ncbi:MAG: HupE/UreJ family protein [Alphaproteobacteria bacterium]|nr:HupE/UreJ family protein [Alphaproteobacteria bacterium]